jgi:hypothetical protein
MISITDCNHLSFLEICFCGDDVNNLFFIYAYAIRYSANLSFPMGVDYYEIIRGGILKDVVFKKLYELLKILIFCRIPGCTSII